MRFGCVSVGEPGGDELGSETTALVGGGNGEDVEDWVGGRVLVFVGRREGRELCGEN